MTRWLVLGMVLAATTLGCGQASTGGSQESTIGRPDFGPSHLGLVAGGDQAEFQVVPVGTDASAAGFRFETASHTPFHGDELDQYDIRRMGRADLASGLGPVHVVDEVQWVPVLLGSGQSLVPISAEGIGRGAIVRAGQFESVVVFGPDGGLRFGLVHEVQDAELWAVGSQELTADLEMLADGDGLCSLVPRTDGQAAAFPAQGALDCARVTVNMEIDR